MASAPSPATPKRIFVADAPRTCSQLFTKLFLAHPQLGHLVHPLIRTMYGPERVFLDLQGCKAAEEADKELVRKGAKGETYDEALRRMEKDIQEIEEQGKIPWIKEHTCCHIRRDIAIATSKSSDIPALDQHSLTNPSVFPDAIFFTLTPVILIRNPVLMIRSCYRVQAPVFQVEAKDERFKWLTTLRFSKMIFDAFYNARGEAPIVVDAEDVVYNTEATMSLLCSRLGIHVDGVQYSWDPLPRQDWPDDPIMQGFFADMLSSSGVNRGKRAAEKILDVDDEMHKWKAEFGEDVAAVLKKRVDEEMPVYEYLKGYKLE